MDQEKRNENLHMLMAFAGNAIFGFSFLFSKLAMNVAEPLVLLAVRFTTAFLLLNILRYSHIVHCEFKDKNIFQLLVLGLYQPVLYFICESYGIKYSTSSFAGIIIALCPIAGIILGRMILKEKPTGLQYIFSIVSVLGVIIMTTTDDFGNFQWKGFFFLIGAVLAGSMFTIQSKKVAEQFSAFERTYVMFGMGTVIFVLMAGFRIQNNWSLWIVPLTNGRFWISILYLSCISSVGAFMLLNKALDVLDATRTLVFANVTTVISVLAGVILLGEQFTAVQGLGIVMVLTGVYGVNRFI